jgi:hypothetical protein
VKFSVQNRAVFMVHYLWLSKVLNLSTNASIYKVIELEWRAEESEEANSRE